MNNVTFGNDTFGYYETIGGGAGASEGYNGVDAVHTHMTNTRITDPEILETRYPIRLTSFQIRDGSGGKGKWSGGNGIIREYQFLTSLHVSILTQRRVHPPYGMNGGEPALSGENYRIFTSGSKQKLGSFASYQADAGESLRICTPGGGGWGIYRK